MIENCLADYSLCFNYLWECDMMVWLQKYISRYRTAIVFVPSADVICWSSLPNLYSFVDRPYQRINADIFLQKSTMPSEVLAILLQPLWWTKVLKCWTDLSRLPLVLLCILTKVLHMLTHIDFHSLTTKDSQLDNLIGCPQTYPHRKNCYKWVYL